MNLALLAGGGIVFFAIMQYYNSFREITWRDFSNNYLNKGNIERLEVVNKKWVKIILKSKEKVSRGGRKQKKKRTR